MKKKNVGKSVKNTWVYGWTHLGLTGQTMARMKRITKDLEVKDNGVWVKCASGCDAFFSTLSDVVDQRNGRKNNSANNL